MSSSSGHYLNFLASNFTFFIGRCAEVRKKIILRSIAVRSRLTSKHKFFWFSNLNLSKFGNSLLHLYILTSIIVINMTTAARPTFDPAKGGSGVKEKGLGKLSQQVSSRDLPSHLTLKERTVGQDTVEELKERDFKAELEEREKIAALERARDGYQYKYVPSLEQTTQVRLALKAERDKEREAQKDALLDSEADLDSVRGPNIINARKLAQLDADEDFGSVNSDSDFDGINDDDDEEDREDERDLDSDSDGADDKKRESGDEEDDDDEDDPEELMAELNRIKQERALEEKRRQEEKKDKEEKTRPNVDEESSSFAIKRRWDDDVPFKNCARGEPDPKRKIFVNDTLRQEFHRKFMDKYIG